MSDEVKKPATGEGGSYELMNVPLEPFERAVYARQHETAAKMFLDVLARLRMGAEIIGYTTDVQTKNVLYTRLAAAVTTLVSDPRFQLSQEGFERVASEHATVDAIFRASTFHTSDHLARQFSEFDPSNVQKIRFRNSPNLGKFLLTYSLSSRLMMDFSRLFQIDAPVTFPLYAGMLAHMSVLTEAAHHRREGLLKLHESFEKLRPDHLTLLVMSDAFMYSSYAVGDYKHEMKRTMNKLFKRFINYHWKGQENVDTLPSRPKRDKPVVLVGNEWFTSVHAMYRCFAPTLMQLKTRYRLVGMGRLIESDVKARELFDEWIMVPDQPILVDLIRTVRKVAPDIILYPSIGMSFWWTALSTVRLAPIQVIGVGHPATTMSPMIDYVVCERGTDPELMSETVVEIPVGSTRFLPRSDTPVVKPAAMRREDGRVHVALPAMAVKLNRPFVETLARIGGRCNGKARFEFFGNLNGLHHRVLEKEIHYLIPDAVVHRRTDVYGEYLQKIRECQLHLSPFPFGGTNSNIDTMLCGIPMIALEGRQPHSVVDAQMLRRADLSGLIAATVEDYENLAVQLILDDDLRETFAVRVRALNLEHLFFDRGPKVLEDAWLAAFAAIEDDARSGRVERPKLIDLQTVMSYSIHAEHWHMYKGAEDYAV